MFKCSKQKECPLKQCRNFIVWGILMQNLSVMQMMLAGTICANEIPNFLNENKFGHLWTWGGQKANNYPGLLTSWCSNNNIYKRVFDLGDCF